MSSPGFKRFVNAIAFISTICIALALVLATIFTKVNNGSLLDLANYIRLVGEVLAYIIVCVMAFFFVRTKRRIVWTIIYVIAVTVIFTMVILVNVL